MTPDDRLPCASVPTGQVVRGPTPGDGVGHALRRSFLSTQAMPVAWQACIDAIDKAGRH